MSETSNAPFEPKDIFQDKFDSLDLELATNHVHATSLHEGKPEFMDWKIDDCLEPSCLTPKLRGAIFFDHSPSVSSGQFLEKQPLEETSEFMYQEEAHPDNSSEVNPENKKECQAETRPNKSDEDLTTLQVATSMAKRDSSIDNGKAVDSCSEHEPEVEKSIKDLVKHTGASKSSVHSDEVLENVEKTPENLEICVKNTT